MHPNKNGICFVSDVIVIPQSEEQEDRAASIQPLHLEADTWRWNPNWEASEYHWLKCGEVIPKNSLCQVCGERVNG